MGSSRRASVGALRRRLGRGRRVGGRRLRRWACAVGLGVGLGVGFGVDLTTPQVLDDEAVFVGPPPAGGMVSKPSGRTPGAVNRRPASARIWLMRGSWIEPRSSYAATDQRVRDHDPVDVSSDRPRSRCRCSPRSARAELVLIVSPTPTQELARVLQEPAADDPVAQGRDDLLLAGLAGEVALAGRLADARVREGVLAVEVVRPGRDVEALDDRTPCSGSRRTRR